MTTFDASPAHAIPGPAGEAAARIAGHLKGGHPATRTLRRASI